MTKKVDIPKLIERHEKQKAYMREYQKKTGYRQVKEYLQSHPEVRLFHSAKSSAKKKGLEFTITIDDIKIPETCPYMGLPITNIHGCGRVKTNASLDRIDSSKGYIPGNVQIVSDLANRMKQNATPEQLLLFAGGIMRVHGTKLDTYQKPCGT